jgi:hypothetical protein
VAQGAFDLREAGPDLGHIGLDRRPPAEVLVDGLLDGAFVVADQIEQPPQPMGPRLPG